MANSHCQPWKPPGYHIGTSHGSLIGSQSCPTGLPNCQDFRRAAIVAHRCPVPGHGISRGMTSSPIGTCSWQKIWAFFPDFLGSKWVERGRRCSNMAVLVAKKCSDKLNTSPCHITAQHVYLSSQPEVRCWTYPAQKKQIRATQMHLTWRPKSMTRESRRVLSDNKVKYSKWRTYMLVHYIARRYRWKMTERQAALNSTMGRDKIWERIQPLCINHDCCCLWLVGWSW